MPQFTDQLGRVITLDHPPRRIVSIVPSQTELLWSLGLDEEVVGITKFCVHPREWFRTKTRVGGTKDLRTAIIQEIRPDLILANKEENVKEQVEVLAEEFPVWVSDIHCLEDALGMIRSVGQLTGREQAGMDLADSISAGFRELAGSLSQMPAPPAGAGPEPELSLRTAYFIWRNPWIVAGGDTFIREILRQGGFTNVFGERTRYPTVTPEELSQSGCQLALLSSEPYPFKEQHIAEIRQYLPDARILLVDGELFSWYGSRLLHTPAYLKHLHQILRQPERSFPA